MNRLLVLISIFMLTASSVAAAEREPLPRPNWNRVAASGAISEAGTRQSLGELFHLAREGRGEDLLVQAQAIAGDRERPDPERDRILYELALALGDLGPGLVGPEALEYLAQTRSRALVPHEESRTLGVPMYNIRAAASGALAAWDRSEGAPAAQAPEFDAFLHGLTGGDGKLSVKRVRQARGTFTPAEIESVLASVEAMPHAGTAAMVLSEMAPAAIDRPAVRELLFGLLEHRELGSTAALTIARSADPVLLERLAATADSGRGLAEKRALLALETALLKERER